MQENYVNMQDDFVNLGLIYIILLHMEINKSHVSIVISHVDMHGTCTYLVLSKRQTVSNLTDRNVIP